jgi:hypothetical protein
MVKMRTDLLDDLIATSHTMNRQGKLQLTREVKQTLTSSLMVIADTLELVDIEIKDLGGQPLTQADIAKKVKDYQDSHK